MNRKMSSLILAAFLLALPIAFSGTDLSAAGSAMGIKEGQKAPDFSLKGLDGKTYTLSEYQGKKVIMLEFWATWCGVCKTEIPELIKDYNSLKDKGFELWAVTLQTGEVSEVREIVEKNNIPYPVLLDEQLTVATKLYKLAGPIPLKVIIDGNGIVRYSHVGDYPVNENEVPIVVEDLIKETLTAAPPTATPLAPVKK